MGKIKEYRNRYKLWQCDSLRHVKSTPCNDAHHCCCCENDFTGNFCPTCGQRSGVRRLTWKGVRYGVLDVWGMGSRALPYTLLQLLFRPGYLIADYISGRRQVSFPPVKMLVIVGLAVFLIDNGIAPPANDTSTGSELEFRWLDHFIDIIAKHYDWSVLFLISFLIIPTYIIFRHSPRCSHHTIPEGFFIQVFNAVQILIVLLVYNVVGKFIEGESAIIDNGASVIVFIILFRTYRQLFGYGFWGTLWRLTIVIFVGLMLSFLIVSAGFCIQLAFDRNWTRLMLQIRSLLVTAAFFTLPTLLAVWINRRSRRKAVGNAATASSETESGQMTDN